MKKIITCILSLALCATLFSPLLPQMVSAAEPGFPVTAVAESIPDETTPNESEQEPNDNTPDTQSSEPDGKSDIF